MADIEVSVTGYCTMGHMEFYLPQRTFGASTSPTKSNVQDIITDIYHEINGVVAALGYELPIPSGNTSSIGILRDINALGAASQVEQSANSIGNIRESSMANNLQEQYNIEFDLLMKGEKNLPGATRNDRYRHDKSQRAPESAFDLDAVGDEDDPAIRKDTKF